MKKLMKRLAVVLLVLTGVYTAVAWFLLRGLGVYRLGTTVGMILAYSWQYTGLAALILLVWLVISLACRNKAKNQKLQTAAPQEAGEPILPDQPEPQKPGKKERRRKEKESSGGKIPPAKAENLEKIQPNMPIAAGSPAAAETAPMPDQVPTATETMPMPELEETMPMPMDEATVSMPTELLPDNEEVATMPMPQDAAVLRTEHETALSGLTCPRCRAAVKPGAKFCGKCGMKLGG